MSMQKRCVWNKIFLLGKKQKNYNVPTCVLLSRTREKLLMNAVPNSDFKIQSLVTDMRWNEHFPGSPRFKCPGDDIQKAHINKGWLMSAGEEGLHYSPRCPLYWQCCNVILTVCSALSATRRSVSFMYVIVWWSHVPIATCSGTLWKNRIIYNIIILYYISMLI